MRVVAHICLTVSNRVGLRRTKSYEQRTDSRTNSFLDIFVLGRTFALMKGFQISKKYGKALNLWPVLLDHYISIPDRPNSITQY